MKELYPRGTKVKIPKTKFGEPVFANGHYKCNCVAEAIKVIEAVPVWTAKNNHNV